MAGEVFSQNVNIKGKIINTTNRSYLVRLLTYNDMLTGEQTAVDETKSDADGNFNIEAHIDEIVMAQLAVDLERVDILLKPNANYDVEIVIPEQKDDVSYYERQTPTLKMNNADDGELYYQYFMSNRIIDDFLLNNFDKIYRGRQLSLIDSVDVEIEKYLGVVNSDFVKENIRYRKASIQMMFNKSRVKEQCFAKQEILYSHPAYMNLFQELFTDYLTSKQFSRSELIRFLRVDYDRFVSYLMQNDVFLAENKDLAELIVAYNLRRMYYEMPDDKKLFLDRIKYLSQNATNQRNRTLIIDMLKQIEHLSFNSEAPDFSFYDRNGNVVKLSDYKDKIVLLQFVNKVSSMTDYQFEVLKEYSNQFQDTVQIVTVATEDCFEDYEKLFDSKSYHWDLLNLGDDILLLEKYRIRTFPDYVILGKNGKVGMAPAPAPDQYLDFHIRRLYKYYKN